MIEQEIWKDVVEWEGYYQISNLGRVKSLARFKRKNDKIIKGSPNPQGYLQVQLRKPLEGRKCLLVHRLVMMHFQPNPFMEELLVNHKDLDVANNKISNLEWVTYQGNSDHYWSSDKALTHNANGATKGEKHHLSVMTDELVIEFRRRWEEVKGVYGQRSKLAREFGISESTARLITEGKTWKYLL